MDDFRAGQHPRDKPQMQVVARQFIHDTGRVRSQRMQVGQIPFRFRVQDIGGQRGNLLGRAQTLGQVAKRGPFPRPMGLGMCADDLLTQGGAGTGHADNEYWRGVTVAGRVFETAGRKGGDARVDKSLVFVAGKRLERLQQRMSLDPMAECGGMFVQSRPEFRQIVMTHDAVLGYSIRAHVVQCRPHLRCRRPSAIPIAFLQREEDMAPQHEWPDRRWYRAERGEDRASFGGAVQLQKRQRFL